MLAAGESRRLGQPKQLVEVGGEALVRRAAAAALNAGADPVVVVVGADAARVTDALAGLPVRTVVNTAWAAGVAGSVRVGVGALVGGADAIDAQRLGPAGGPSSAPGLGGLDAILVTVADQPFVDAEALGRLAGAFHAGGRPMAAAAYDGTVGVPAVFGRAYFSALRALPDGDRGAGALLRAAREGTVTRVHLPTAAFDLDTPADLARLAAGTDVGH